MKYRKKPVVIEAFVYNDNDSLWPEWFKKGLSQDTIRAYHSHCEINTLEGVMKGNVGDYIIQGVKFEIYPCKPDIFVQTYEQVDEKQDSL